MNKQEFLTALRMRLSGLAETEIERPLNYYSEMIDDRMEEGLTEDQAVEAIGTVEQVSSQILEDMPKAQTVSANANVSKEEKIFTVGEAFSGISAECLECGIELCPADNGICRIVFRETGSARISVTVTDDTLFIKREGERKWFENFTDLRDKAAIRLYLPKKEYAGLYIKTSSGDVKVPGGFGFTAVNIGTKSGVVMFCASVSGLTAIKAVSGDIGLYSTSSANISAQSTKGDVSAENVLAENEMKIEATSGDIRLLCVRSGELTVGSVSGDISIDKASSFGLIARSTNGDMAIRNVISETDISVSAVNGDVKLSGIKARDVVSSSVNGDIAFTSVTATGSIRISNQNGDIHLTESDAGDLTLKTTSGDISGTLLTEKIFSATALSGSVSVPHTSSGGRCEAKTLSGDITLRIK